jgi:hypothetical protein
MQPQLRSHRPQKPLCSICRTLFKILKAMLTQFTILVFYLNGFYVSDGREIRWGWKWTNCLLQKHNFLTHTIHCLTVVQITLLTVLRISEKFFAVTASRTLLIWLVHTNSHSSWYSVSSAAYCMFVFHSCVIIVYLLTIWSNLNLPVQNERTADVQCCLSYNS